MNSDRNNVALVTGGARRIGQAIALALAKAGWDIVIHYNTAQREAQETVAAITLHGVRATALQCDLNDASAVSTLLDRARAVFGQVSCLVNNASTFEFDDARNFNPALLASHMQINVSAPIALAQALHAGLKSGEQAVVINLLDQKLFNLNPDFLSYTISKAGLQCATTLLAQALAPAVRVVGIAPGITLPSGAQTQQEFTKAHGHTPLGHSSTLDDIAAAVCFVAASQSITGTTIVVDGGQHLIPLPRDVMFLTN